MSDDHDGEQMGTLTAFMHAHLFIGKTIHLCLEWSDRRELEWCVQTLQYQVGQSIQAESHSKSEENVDYHNVNSTSIKQGGEEVKESLNHNSHKSFFLGLAQE